MIKILLAFLAFAAIAIIADFLAYRKSRMINNGPKKILSVACHAGGELYIQGGGTYYRLPKGTVRKVADYEMDLSPQSVDMDRWRMLMEQAESEHKEEKA